MSSPTSNANLTKPTLKAWAWDNTKTLGVALVIALVIRSFFFGNYKIPTPSMVPSLLVGDHLFVSKLSYSLKLPVPLTNINLYTYDHPRRGDVIVFQSVQDSDTDFIKRVIGIPGDKIEVRDDQVFVNDAVLPRTSVGEEQDPTDDFFPYFDRYRETIDGVTFTMRLRSEDRLEEGMQSNPALRWFYYQNIERARNFGPFTVPEGQYFVMGDNRHNSSDSREWGTVPFENIRGKAKVIWLSWNSESDTLLGHLRWDRFFSLIH